MVEFLDSIEGVALALMQVILDQDRLAGAMQNETPQTRIFALYSQCLVAVAVARAQVLGEPWH